MSNGVERYTPCFIKLKNRRTKYYLQMRSHLGGHACPGVWVTGSYCSHSDAPNTWQLHFLSEFHFSWNRHCEKMETISPSFSLFLQAGPQVSPQVSRHSPGPHHPTPTSLSTPWLSVHTDQCPARPVPVT